MSMRMRGESFPVTISLLFTARCRRSASKRSKVVIVTTSTKGCQQTMKVGQKVELKKLLMGKLKGKVFDFFMLLCKQEIRIIIKKLFCHLSMFLVSSTSISLYSTSKLRKFQVAILTNSEQRIGIYIISEKAPEWRYTN